MLLGMIARFFADHVERRDSMAFQAPTATPNDLPILGEHAPDEGPIRPRRDALLKRKLGDAAVLGRPADDMDVTVVAVRY